jgi:hypothetical protein
MIRTSWLGIVRARSYWKGSDPCGGVMAV